MRARRSSRSPSVTVVIPCYNYGHFLPDLVHSVLSQAGVSPQVLIVDDASPDGSGDVAEKLAADDERVTVVRNEVNLGHIATYNVGLSRVTTKYASLVSADDMLPPGALGRATALMETYPAVGLVYGLTRSFSGEPPEMPDTQGSWTIWPGDQWVRFACRRGRNFIMSPEVVMRTDALHQVGLYNPGLPHSGDLEFWLRTASRWGVGRINGPVQALYRVHESNMHLTTFATMAVDIRHRSAAFDTILGLKDPEFPGAPSHVARAHRALANEAALLAERHLDSGGGPDVARALLEVAHEVHPAVDSSRRVRSVTRRLSVATSDASLNDRRHTIREKVRLQMDRVRWKFWNAVGTS